MDAIHRTNRTRGAFTTESGPGGTRPHSRNKHWVAGDGGSRSGRVTPAHIDGERWSRGGHRGRPGSRGTTRGGARKFPNATLHVNSNTQNMDMEFAGSEGGTEPDEELHDEEEENLEVDDVEPETAEGREQFYQELVKAREVERKKAIAEGKMDDPLIPKRLEDAISIVGTCMDMCPRFERYRRERENNLFEWETIPGTKRVNHKRAVKMYERAAGDKVIPSDLRPPTVLKRTLDYLFRDLLPREGFSRTFNFIRDRSRAVRNDFTMQHNTDALAIECHDRCARFHILALHFERDREGFSIALEEQQLMNTLQSLKEFYDDQRGRYESPTELEMRVYHRLIHIRDQKERNEDIPAHITEHPVFKLTTDFRIHVQRKSAPITKVSSLVVDAEGMQIFGKLANVLRDQGSVVMIYLVACILERLFGKETIDDIEAIRGDLEVPDIIDGISTGIDSADVDGYVSDDHMQDELDGEEEHFTEEAPLAPSPLKASATEWLSSAFGPQPTPLAFGVSSAPPPTKPVSAFSSLAATPNVFGTPSIFGNSSTSGAPGTSLSAFGTNMTTAFSQLPSSLSQSAPSSHFGSPSISNAFQAPTPNSAEPTHPQTPIPNFFAPKNDASNVVPSSSTAQPSASLFAPTEASRLPTPVTPTGQSSDKPSMSQSNDSLKASSNPTTSTQSLLDSQLSWLNPRAPVFSPTLSHYPLQFPLVNGHAKPPPDSAPLPQAVSEVVDGSSAASSATFSLSNLNKPVSSPSDPTNRTTFTPPTLKINTNAANAQQNGSPWYPTSTPPPPLPKKQPISLPSTPAGIQPPNPFPASASFRYNLDTPGANSSSEILSPLNFQSPSIGSSAFSPNGSLKSMDGKGALERLTNLLNGKGKARQTAPDMEQPVPEELNVKAFNFLQRSLLVKECFHQWEKRATDKAAWIEACRQSESYRKKILHSSQGPTSDKKRRISAGPSVSVESPQPKRIRKRISSSYQPPRTDEELARRFKENHEEHERRWAQGSFLQVIRTHVNAQISSASLRKAWHIWISMNPESDATAIWLERKFDIPSSGQWISEAVFSIPLADRKASSAEFPGVIVFECTPLEGIADDIERKYRILDDCSRLRDIINALPTKRHCIPSLLVLSWAENQSTTAATDFSDMITKLVGESIIGGYHVFSIASGVKDLDEKLDGALKSLTLDTEGRLVKSLNLRDMFKLFEPLSSPFISEWLETCSRDGYYDWDHYGRLLEVAVLLLNEMAQCVHRLLGRNTESLLPAFHARTMADSELVYDSVFAWLAAANFGSSADDIAVDLHSHRDIGNDFPSGAFIEHLGTLIQSQAELRAGADAKSKTYILISEITASLAAFRLTVENQRIHLGHALNMSIRRSPKRRGVSEDIDLMNSQSKRRRLSSSLTVEDLSPPLSPGAQINGRDTPSPSNTTMSVVSVATTTATAEPLVTVAMLRALTRDMKQKYKA